MVRARRAPGRLSEVCWTRQLMRESVMTRAVLIEGFSSLLHHYSESTNLGVVVAKSGNSFFDQKEPPRRDKSIAHSGDRNGDD